MGQNANGAYPLPPDAGARLNRLLECELSAVETYQRAIRKLEALGGIDALARIEQEHWEAVGWLRARIRDLGGTPVASSGVWGAWPAAVEATARVVGEIAELDALLQEEKHSLARYREILGDDGLDGQTRELIVTKLLLRAEQHLEVLEKRIAL